jgi:hypothetical protein
MNRNSIFSILLLLFLVPLSGCQKSNLGAPSIFPTPPPWKIFQGSIGSMQCNFQGKSSFSDSLTMISAHQVGPAPDYIDNIQDASYDIDILAAITGTGTYILNYTGVSNRFQMIWCAGEYLGQFTLLNYHSPGSLTITYFDPLTRTMSGNFSFMVYDTDNATPRAISGSFSQLPYHHP